MLIELQSRIAANAVENTSEEALEQLKISKAATKMDTVMTTASEAA